MRSRSSTFLGGLLLSVLILPCLSSPVPGQDYDSLRELTSIKAVFDFRSGDPKSAAMLLDLIAQTYKDENIRNVTQSPEVVIVFLGPAVKLISNQREGFSEEERAELDKIARTVGEMSGDGIGLEVCMFAARVYGIDPATVLPEIRRVENGWISMIGYQAKGYSLIPVY